MRGSVGRRRISMRTIFMGWGEVLRRTGSDLSWPRARAATWTGGVNGLREGAWADRHLMSRRSATAIATKVTSTIVIAGSGLDEDC
jgi:hypothetical protein